MSSYSRPRKAPATAEEVLTAVADLSSHFHTVRFYSALTIAGLVARQRGCPDSWPSRDRIAAYVSFSSVKRVLLALVTEGKLYAISGNHWAVHVRAGKATFYIDDVARRLLILKHREINDRERLAARERWVTEKVLKANVAYVEELTNRWDKDNPEPNWEELW